MATRRPLTNRELQGRLDDLEGALNDERNERLAQGAEHDEDIETHTAQFGTLAEDISEIQRRLKRLESRCVMKPGRPAKGS